MPSNLYSGAAIKAMAQRGRKIGHRHASGAVAAILRRYKSLSPTGEYYHRGKGYWCQYSESADRKRHSSSLPKWELKHAHFGDHKSGVSKKQRWI